MMNINSLNQAQTVYALEQICKMGERYIDVCKDIQVNQDAFTKVLRLIGSDVYKNMLPQIDNASIITASDLNDSDKCRSLIESWWTLSKVDAIAITIFLLHGEFDTKKHRAWISDVVGKPVNQSYMNRLAWILAVVIYAVLYI